MPSKQWCICCRWNFLDSQCLLIHRNVVHSHHDIKWWELMPVARDTPPSRLHCSKTLTAAQISLINYHSSTIFVWQEVINRISWKNVLNNFLQTIIIMKKLSPASNWLDRLTCLQSNKYICVGHVNIDVMLGFCSSVEWRGETLDCDQWWYLDTADNDPWSPATTETRSSSCALHNCSKNR